MTFQLFPGPPVFAKARGLDPEKLASVKAEFAKMKAAGLIQRSSSTWSSHLHSAKKSEGFWCPYGDYRRLNTVTVPDRYFVLSTWMIFSSILRIWFLIKIITNKSLGFAEITASPST